MDSIRRDDAAVIGEKPQRPQLLGASCRC